MIKKKTRERIDKILVDRGLVSTRSRAQAMIMAGHVLVNEVPVVKPGEKVEIESKIRLREPELKYVSRGALKLLGALDSFEIKVDGRVGIDIGASTGGFTEVLLERGAKLIHAVDVGTNQLAWRIRSDSRVVVHENYNARNYKSEDFSQQFDILVMDVSFISIRLILPEVLQGLTRGADLVILYKPQFELGKEWIGEGGIVRDQTRSLEHLQETLKWAESLDLRAQGWIQSPISGTDGNVEYLIHFTRGDSEKN